MRDFLENEQVAEGKYPIRYVLKEYPNAEWLIVVFSAFAPVNHPIQHPYHFTNVLDSVPAHRLYIQDSQGRHGTYYLCDHMDFGVEESVSALICRIQSSLSCSNSRTIALGSSKGGSAAAYFALKHGFCHGIAMVPQFLIGSYIRNKRETLEDMVGETEKEQGINVLDSLILCAAKENLNTKLHVLTSENDEQYTEQILPFINMLKESNLASKHDIMIENKILSHNDAARLNPDFAHQKLCECMYGALLTQEDDCLTLLRDKSFCPNDNMDIVVEYVYEDNGGSEFVCLLTDTIQTISLNKIRYGELRVRKGTQVIYRRCYCPWVVDAVTAICKEMQSYWEISFNISKGCTTPFQYTYYAFDEDNRRIHAENYSNNATFHLSKEEGTLSRVQCFWFYKNLRFFKPAIISETRVSVDFDSLSYHIDTLNGKLNFKILHLPERHRAQFAYYVNLNGKTIFKQGYSSSPYFYYTPAKEGKYSVIYFVRQEEGTRYKESSSVLFLQENADIIGPTHLKALSQKVGICDNEHQNSFAVVDILPIALRWKKEVFSTNRNDTAVQQMRKEIESLVKSANELPIYLLEWNLWNVTADESRQVHWLLEECYDAVRKHHVSHMRNFSVRAKGTYEGNDWIYWLYSSQEREVMSQLHKMLEANYQRDLDHGCTEVTLQGNQLTAEIQMPNIKPEDRFAFYLLRNDTVIDRQPWTTEAKYSWTVSESGIYVVRGFIMRNVYKTVKNSIPVSFFTEQDQTLFEEFLRTDCPPEQEFSLKKDLTFPPSSSPFCDICIISKQDVSNLGKLPELCNNMPGSARIQIGNWNTVIYSNAPPIQFHNGKRMLFSGAGVFDKIHRRGQDEFSDTMDISSETLFGEIGQYSGAVWDENELTVGTDLFAFKRWFFFETDGLFILANSYHLLLLAIRDCGHNLRLDVDKAGVTLSSMRVPMLLQNFTRQMDMKDTYQIPADKQLRLTENGWVFVESALGKILSSDEPYHEETYRELLLQAKEELLENGRRILKDPHYDTIVTDLTGGLDSRLVYSIMTAIPESRGRVSINSHDVPGSKDLPIAVGINHIYQYPFNSAGEKQYCLPVLEADTLNRSFYLGTYYSHTMINRGRVTEDRVDLVGACGEILARPYVTRKYLRTYMEDFQSIAAFTDAWYRDISTFLVTGNEKIPQLFSKYFGEELAAQPVNSVFEALECIYLMYRHGYHFDVISSRLGFLREYPLQSKTMFRLHHMSFAVHKSIRLQLDILNQMNPLLAAVEFDSDDDNRDAHNLKEDLVLDERFSNIKVHLNPDMETWEEANARCRASSAVVNKQDPAYRHLSESIYEALLNNLRQLLLLQPELCQLVGPDLYYHLSKLDKNSRLTVYWYNKVTSLLDQTQIFLPDGKLT